MNKTGQKIFVIILTSFFLIFLGISITLLITFEQNLLHFVLTCFCVTECFLCGVCSLIELSGLFLKDEETDDDEKDR